MNLINFNYLFIMKETNDKGNEIKKINEEEKVEAKSRRQENGPSIFSTLFISSIYVGSVTVAGMYDKYIFTHEIENTDKIQYFQKFMHPMFLTVNMFAGMALWNIFYFGKRLFLKNLPPLPPFNILLLMCIPSFLDNAFTSVLLYGRMITAPSVNRTLSSIMLIGNMVMSYFFLKSKFSRNSVLGAFFIFVGSTIVGFNAISEKGLGQTSSLGLSIIIFYYIFCNIQLILEEYLLKGLKNIDLDPMLLVGIEGLTGLVYSCGFILIGNLIPCTPIGDNDYALCAYKYVENINIAFKQLNLAPKIIVYSIVQMIALGIFNFVALKISKIINSTYRTILGFLNVILIWVHSVLMGWENLKPLQLLGYSIIIIGVLVFREIVHLIKEKEEDSNTGSKVKSD